MAALKFVSEVVSPVSTVFLAGDNSPLLHEIEKQISSTKHLEIFSAQTPRSVQIVIYLAGFTSQGLQQTLNLTAHLVPQLEFARIHRAKFILVVPEPLTHASETAFSLVKQFAHENKLDYLLITLPVNYALGETATAIVRSFYKNFQYVAPTELQPTNPIKTTGQSKKRRVWKWLVFTFVLITLEFSVSSGLLGLGVYALKTNQGQLATQAGQWASWGLAPWGTLSQASQLISQLGKLEEDPFNTPITPITENLANLQANPAIRFLPKVLQDQIAAVRQDADLWESVQSTFPGDDNSVDWLVLLQDPFELRPSGGYLGDFAIVSFSRHQIDKIQLYDTATTDSLLHGQVIPPADLQKTTGQSSWYMRDGNWDPDFAVAADRVVWFANKELRIAPQGVVAVNLRNLSDWLNVTGPLALPGGQAVTASNWPALTNQAITQGREDQFIKDLTQVMFQKIGLLTDSQRLKLGEIILRQMANRQLGVRAGVLNNLALPGCLPNVWCDRIAVIDTNVGDTKANEGIEPAYHFVSQKTPTGEQYQLQLTYANTNKGGSKEDYVNYVRVLLPDNTQVDQLQWNNQVNSFQANQTPNFTQLASLVTVPVGQSGTLAIKAHRSLPANLGPGYEFDWYNQPGQPAIPVTIAAGDNFRYNGALTRPIHLWQANTP